MNPIMGHFLVGLIIIALGGVVIYFSPRATEFFGRMERAEQHLGGTRNAFVLFGFIVVVIGILFMFGILQGGSPVAQV